MQKRIINQQLLVNTVQKWLNKHTLILLWTALIGIWLSHAINIFTPEVGFDAVWYHLPVAEAIWESGRLVFLPDLYQSVNPLFSDLFFTIGFGLGGELGAKVVAYLFGLGLITITYFLARELLPYKWSLLVIVLISTFQVIAWQSSSFYVDVAKAFWELAALLFLIKWLKMKDGDVAPASSFILVVASGLLFGASLGTKLFSLFLFPFFVGVILWRSTHIFRDTIVFSLASSILSLPFYLHSYKVTGTPWFSFHQHVQKLGEIGASSSVFEHLLLRTAQLPTLPFSLITARDYTSFVLLLFLPLLVIGRKEWQFLTRSQLIQQVSPVLSTMAGFTLIQVIIWWYLPPLSTRYALSGFVVWAVLVIGLMKMVVDRDHRFYLPLVSCVVFSVMLNMAPRLFVNWRSMQYILGKQSKETYIHQFYDGTIDDKLQSWHHLDQ